MNKTSLNTKSLLIFFIVLLVSLFFIKPSISQENLTLTGIIRSVDAISGIVRIQVTTEKCQGLWNFRMPDYAKEDLNKSMIGRRVQFAINSSVCDRRNIYTRILGR